MLATRVVGVRKTRAVFDRYNIVQEAELQEAGTRLLSYLATQPVAEATCSHC